MVGDRKVNNDKKKKDPDLVDLFAINFDDICETIKNKELICETKSFFIPTINPGVCSLWFV